MGWGEGGRLCVDRMFQILDCVSLRQPICNMRISYLILIVLGLVVSKTVCVRACVRACVCMRHCACLRAYVCVSGVVVVGGAIPFESPVER